VPTHRAELLHVVVARPTDRVHTRPTQIGPVNPELLDGQRDPVGVPGSQPSEPPLSLRIELDLPRASARHTETVASPPVTEQDAFVPSLSILATPRPRLPPPPARRLGSARATADAGHTPRSAADYPPSAFNSAAPSGEPLPVHASQPGPAW
jgi:hypothetical protein